VYILRSSKKDIRGKGKTILSLDTNHQSKGEIARARSLFCQLAVNKMGYSGAEVPRFLGVTTSSVNRLENSEELPSVKEYIKLLYPPFRGLYKIDSFLGLYGYQ